MSRDRSDEPQERTDDGVREERRLRHGDEAARDRGDEERAAGEHVVMVRDDDERTGRRDASETEISTCR